MEPHFTAQLGHVECGGNPLARDIPDAEEEPVLANEAEVVQIPADLLPEDGRFGCGPSRVRKEALAALEQVFAETMPKAQVIAGTMSPTSMRGCMEPLSTTNGRQPMTIGSSVTSRQPATNHSHVRATIPAVSRASARPPSPVPAFALRLMFGEMADAAQAMAEGKPARREQAEPAGP